MNLASIDTCFLRDQIVFHRVITIWSAAPKAGLSKCNLLAYGPTPAQISIYTAGSLTETHARAGYTIRECNKEIHWDTIRLSLNTTVFQAEKIAIRVYISSSDTGAAKIPKCYGFNSSDSFFWLGFSSSEFFCTLLKLYIAATRS